MFPSNLQERMNHLGIREEDLEEAFVRSSGPGGQNVNKVATCVSLLHRPSNLQIKCQSQRTQMLNRIKARWMLIEKIESIRKEIDQEKISLREKERRKNRKRPQSLKEEILKKKKIHSEKKSNRKKLNWKDY